MQLNIFGLSNTELISYSITILLGFITIRQTSKANKLEKQKFQYEKEQNAMAEKQETFHQGLKTLRIEEEVEVYFEFLKRKFQYLDFYWTKCYFAKAH